MDAAATLFNLQTLIGSFEKQSKREHHPLPHTHQRIISSHTHTHTHTHTHNTPHPKAIISSYYNSSQWFPITTTLTTPTLPYLSKLLLRLHGSWSVQMAPPPCLPLVQPSHPMSSSRRIIPISTSTLPTATTRRTSSRSSSACVSSSSSSSLRTPILTPSHHVTS